MDELDGRAVFEQSAARTRERSPATFDQWFGGIQFDDLTEGVLTLRAQNEFVLDWVKTNFLPDLVEQIRSVSGWSVQVNWIMDVKLADPVALRFTGAAPSAATTPVRPRALSSVSGPASESAVETPKRMPPPEDINPRYTFRISW